MLMASDTIAGLRELDKKNKERYIETGGNGFTSICSFAHLQEPRWISIAYLLLPFVSSFLETSLLIILFNFAAKKIKKREERMC